MIRKYVGVHCADCNKFIVVSSHEVEKTEDIGTDLTLTTLERPLRCSHCGAENHYSDEEIAHSIFADGTNPQYPKRK